MRPQFVRAISLSVWLLRFGWHPDGISVAHGASRGFTSPIESELAKRATYLRRVDDNIYVAPPGLGLHHLHRTHSSRCGLRIWRLLRRLATQTSRPLSCRLPSAVCLLIFFRSSSWNFQQVCSSFGNAWRVLRVAFGQHLHWRRLN